MAVIPMLSVGLGKLKERRVYLLGYPIPYDRNKLSGLIEGCVFLELSDGYLFHKIKIHLTLDFESKSFIECNCPAVVCTNM